MSVIKLADSPKFAPGSAYQTGREVDGAGGGGDDGSMEARLSAVEQSIARIDASLPNLATKAELAELRADVHRGFADQTKWIIGTGVAGIAVFITVMTFVLNNATPKAPAPVAQAPIIINVPQAAAPVASTAR